MITRIINQIYHTRNIPSFHIFKSHPSTRYHNNSSKTKRIKYTTRLLPRIITIPPITPSFSTRTFNLSYTKQCYDICSSACSSPAATCKSNTFQRLRGRWKTNDSNDLVARSCNSHTLLPVSCPRKFPGKFSLNTVPRKKARPVLCSLRLMAAYITRLQPGINRYRWPDHGGDSPCLLRCHNRHHSATRPQRIFFHSPN